MHRTKMDQGNGDAAAIDAAFREAAEAEARYETQEMLLREVRGAVSETMMEHLAKVPVLSDEELKWVRLAIKREAKRAERWEAVMTHTLKGLAWVALVALGSMFIAWLADHGIHWVNKP